MEPQTQKKCRVILLDQNYVRTSSPISWSTSFKIRISEGPAIFFKYIFFILARGALSKMFSFNLFDLKNGCGLLQGRPDFSPDEATLAAEDGDQLVKERVAGEGGGSVCRVWKITSCQCIWDWNGWPPSWMFFFFFNYLMYVIDAIFHSLVIFHDSIS